MCRYERLKTSHGQPDVCVCVGMRGLRPVTANQMCVCVCVYVWWWCVCVGMRGLRPVTANQMCVCVYVWWCLCVCRYERL